MRGTEFGLSAGEISENIFMQKTRLIFTALLVPVDFFMIVLAGLAAYGLRFTTPLTDVLPVIFEVPFQEYLQIVFGTALIWLFFFAVAGLYAMRSDRRFFPELAKIFLACSAGIMAIIVVMFFVRELFSSRFIVLTAWVFSVAFVALGRRLMLLIERIVTKQGIGLRRTVLIGDSWFANNLAEMFQKSPSKGFIVVHRFGRFDDATERELREITVRGEIDEIILADPLMDRKTVSLVLEFADDHHLGFRYVPDVFAEKSTAVEVQLVGEIPLLAVRRTALDGWGRIAKRTIDIVGSLIGIIILSPVFLLIAVCILLDSPGPIIVRLKRVGLNGKQFSLYKFRSMVDGAHRMKSDLMKYNERKDGPLFKMTNDPRVTRVGKLLRKTSLDELAQLFNVFKGEMSLVGPRAHEPEEVARYTREYRKLLSVRPGITGLPQISGRDKLEFSREAQLDIFYIEHWSLKMDVVILVKTPFVVLVHPAV